MTRKLTGDGENVRVARNMLLVMGLLLLTKLVGAGKEVAIAWRFGTDATVDGYLFLVNIVGLPVTVWYGVISVLFIPTSVRMRDQNPSSYRRFTAETFGLSLVAAMLATAGTQFAVQTLIATGATGLSGRALSTAADAVPWLVPLVPLGFLAHYGSVLLMSNRNHVNTLLEGVPAIILLGALLLLPVRGIAPLVIGTLAGGAMHALVTFGILHRNRLLGPPAFRFTSPAWDLLRSALVVMLVAQVLQSLTALVDQFFAAPLGPGSIATLGYANRILALLLTLGSTAIGRAALPIFSEFGQNPTERLRKATFGWARIMLLLGGALLLIGALGSHLIVRTLFERGAFTSSDTATVASVLRYGLLQTPFYFAAMVMSQALFTTGAYRTIAVVAAINLVIKVLASVILVPIFGIAGLMLATAVMYITTCGTLIYALRRAHSQIQHPPNPRPIDAPPE